MKIDPPTETKKIITFLQKTCAKQGIDHAVLGISGGIDSTTSLFLLKEVLPVTNIFVSHLSYFPKKDPDIERIVSEAGIPDNNITHISIKPAVDQLQKILGVKPGDTIRLGNIMARVRMIALYDLAKKHNGLVVGTENKSEYYLGYFTRFGDEASDIEPIRHLYKTQVYELAKYLGVPHGVLEKAPTAGLWTGQTDEKEFGFSYKEADQVLYYYFEEKLSISEIKKKGLKNTEVILQRVRQTEYKHKTPYSLS